MLIDINEELLPSKTESTKDDTAGNKTESTKDDTAGNKTESTKDDTTGNKKSNQTIEDNHEENKPEKLPSTGEKYILISCQKSVYFTAQKGYNGVNKETRGEFYEGSQRL